MALDMAADMVRKGSTFRAASTAHDVPLATLAEYCRSIGVRGRNRRGCKAAKPGTKPRFYDISREPPPITLAGPEWSWPT